MAELNCLKELTLNFNLRKPTSKRPTNVYAVVKVCGKQLKIPTTVKINAYLWDSKKQVPMLLNSMSDAERDNAKRVFSIINSFQSAFSDYYCYFYQNFQEPFKLLFLLTALTLVVESGINLKGENFSKSYKEQVVEESADSIAKNQADMTFSEHFDRAQNELIQGLRNLGEKNPSLFWLLMLTMLSAPLYLLFRKCPTIPDLRFSELIITLVYTYDMFALYNTIFTFFCIPDGFDDVVWLLPAIPLKQLSGFKWWRTILYSLLSYIAMFMILVGMLCAIAAILYYV